MKSNSRSGRTIVVGDIHGCYDELMDLLAVAKIATNDRIIAVGDLLSKGPKSAAVLDLFISDLRYSSVIGNHDLALVRYWRGERRRLTAAQRQTTNELEAHRNQYFSYLASLPLWIEVNGHLVVHAGIRPGVPLADQSVEDLTTIRSLGVKPDSRKGVPWYRVYDGEKKVVFGHWPARRPRLGSHAIGLDTGCVYGHRLTAFIIESESFISVSARAAYAQSRTFNRRISTASPNTAAVGLNESTKSIQA